MTDPRSKYRVAAGDRGGGDFAARHLGDRGGEGGADGGAAGVCSGRGLLCGQGVVGVSTVDSDPRRNDFSGLGVDVKEMETFGGAAAGLKENPVSKVTSRLTGTAGAGLDAGIGWQIGVRGGLEKGIGRITGRAAATGSAASAASPRQDRGGLAWPTRARKGLWVAMGRNRRNGGGMGFGEGDWRGFEGWRWWVGTHPTLADFVPKCAHIKEPGRDLD